MTFKPKQYVEQTENGYYTEDCKETNCEPQINSHMPLKIIIIVTLISFFGEHSIMGNDKWHFGHSIMGNDKWHFGHNVEEPILKC